MSLATGGDGQESQEVWTLAPLRVYEEEPSQRPQQIFLESQKVIETARSSWYDAKKRRGRRQDLKKTTRRRSDRCVQDQCRKVCWNFASHKTLSILFNNYFECHTRVCSSLVCSLRLFS